jgi:hypothetical protein
LAATSCGDGQHGCHITCWLPLHVVCHFMRRGLPSAGGRANATHESLPWLELWTSISSHPRIPETRHAFIIIIPGHALRNRSCPPLLRSRSRVASWRLGKVRVLAPTWAVGPMPALPAWAVGPMLALLAGVRGGEPAPDGVQSLSACQTEGCLGVRTRSAPLPLGSVRAVRDGCRGCPGAVGPLPVEAPQLSCPGTTAEWSAVVVGSPFRMGIGWVWVLDGYMWVWVLNGQ